jgi:predicted transcriptional regulator
LRDIFDTENIDDLPPELINELNLAGDSDKMILDLFQESNDGALDLSELLVAYYRKHNEVKKRQYMMTTCYRLVKKGFLESTGSKGEYRITDKGKKIAKISKNEHRDLV